MDARAVLRGLNLPTDIPASSELFVSPLSTYEFFEKSAEAANDRYFGFTIGHELDLLLWEPISFSVMESKTLGELLNRFVINALDHSSSTRFFLKAEGDQATFGFKRVIEPPFPPAHNDAFFLAF